MKIHILPVIASLLLSWPCLAAPETAEPSPESAVLHRRVGTWDNVNTVKPGPWVPEGSKTQSIETIRWILGHAFIEGNARETGSHSDHTHLVGYDSTSKCYRMWYFDSAGNFPHPEMVGQWDAANHSLVFGATTPDGVVVKAVMKFVGADHIDWRAMWTGKDGGLLMDMTATQTRRAIGADEKGIEPSKDAAPDPAGPPELARYAGFVGDWNATVRDNTAPQPEWNRADGNHKTWTLGGRFIRDEIRNAQGDLTMLGFWTYDAAEKTHREWYFLADGNVIEIVATWDGALNMLNIDGKFLRGGTIHGPRRVTGPNAYMWDAIIRDDAGKVLANLTGRQERAIAHDLPPDRR